MKIPGCYFFIEVVNAQRSFGILSFFPYLWSKALKMNFGNLFGAITSMKNGKFKIQRLINSLQIQDMKKMMKDKNFYYYSGTSLGKIM